MHTLVSWGRARRLAGPLACATALLSLLLALGCGGGAASTDPQPPRAVRLEVIPSPGDPPSLRVRWDAAPGEVDGYVVELKVGAEAYRAVSDPGTPIAPDAREYLIPPLPDDAPDLVPCAVRMRSVRAGATSGASNEVTVLRPLNPPRQVVATYDWDRAGMALSWSPHSTAAAGAVVERALLDDAGYLGDFAALSPAPPAGATSYLDVDAVLGRSYAYRVVNAAGAARSGPSAMTSPTLAGLLAPNFIAVLYDDTSSAVRLAWSTRTTAATGTRLERRLFDAAHAPVGPWVALPLPPGVQEAYQDSGWEEGKGYAYQVTNLRDAHESLPAVLAFVQTGLRPPADLTASAEGAAVRLDWVNRSQAAAGITVYWLTQSPAVLVPVATIAGSLPPTATSLRIDGLGLGHFRFSVQPYDGALGLTGRALVDFTTPSPPDALALASAPVLAPASVTDAAVLPTGGWAFLSHQPPALTIFARGTDWPRIDQADAPAGQVPFFAVDGQGHPHVVYVAETPGGVRTLTHLWFDGAAWSEEAMYVGRLAREYREFMTVALDPDGVPQAVVAVSTLAGGFEAIHVRRAGAAWTSEPVPVPDLNPGDHGLVALGVDADGVSRFVARKTEFSRDLAGVWLAAEVATIADARDRNVVRAASWIDGSQAAVMLEQNDAATDGGELRVAERVGGAWQPVRTLSVSGDAAEAGRVPAREWAVSRDGARLAVGAHTRVGLRAFHRDAGGWHASLLGGPLVSDWFRVGFDGAGKVHWLLRTATAPGAFSFEELAEP